MSPEKTAVIVAHPGHELRIHGWLEEHHPIVFVLTDGSGNRGTSRLHSSERILARTGSRKGSVFGALSDRDAYRHILEGNTAPFVEILRMLSEEMAAEKIQRVFGDAAELYNPTHDICRVLINLATDRLAAMSAASIDNFEFSLVETQHQCPRPDRPHLHRRLDDEALRRKIDHAAAYVELNKEFQEGMTTHGTEAYRYECLVAVNSETSPQPNGAKPYYERYGEQQVQAGLYRDVLRYREHFLPFAEELTMQVHQVVS